MIVTTSMLHAARTKIAAGALLALAATAVHAAAKNHDVQQIRIPSPPMAGHDRALGPTSHDEN